jgi:hypothetical protein
VLFAAEAGPALVPKQGDRSMTLSVTLRRLTYATHVTSSVAWLGAVLVFVALASLGLNSQDERTVRGAYLVMAPAAWFVLVPLAHASLFSGLALSLGTPWGLIRHYWVAIKLIITAFSTVVLMIYMGTFRQMAGVASDPVVDLGLVRNPSPLVHSILALVLLTAATALAIYKPFGLTPYGTRQQMRTRVAAPVPATAPDHGAATGSGRQWEYMLWFVALAILALIVVSHLLGSGSHGH